MRAAILYQPPLRGADLARSGDSEVRDRPCNIFLMVHWSACTSVKPTMAGRLARSRIALAVNFASRTICCFAASISSERARCANGPPAALPASVAKQDYQ